MISVLGLRVITGLESQAATPIGKQTKAVESTRCDRNARFISAVHRKVSLLLVYKHTNLAKHKVTSKAGNRELRQHDC
jgi:hypothetical protein